MANKHKKSTYYFIGRLSPVEFCTKFNPGELHLGNGFVMEVFWDGIAIWISGTAKTFDVLRPQVMNAFDVVISTFILLTNNRINFTLQSWVEAKKCISRNNIIGFIIPPGTKISTPNPKSRPSVAWRKAAKYYSKIEKNFYHRMALKDFNNCINAYGDDSFFYAYRVVEDVRRAITGHMKEGLDTKEYWKEMHRILGTTKGQIEPLTRVSEKVRHGEINHSIMKNARKNKEKIVNISIAILKKEFKRSFKGLL